MVIRPSTTALLRAVLLLASLPVYGAHASPAAQSLTPYGEEAEKTLAYDCLTSGTAVSGHGRQQ